MKYVKGIAVILIALAVVYAGKRYFGQTSLPAKQAGARISTVEVEPVATRQFATKIEALGTASANESVTITASVSERISKISFQEGARVEKGATLVQLENAEEMADLQEARVEVEENQRELARVKALREKKMVSVEDFDNQQSSTQAAEARLAQAQARLHDLTIKAPFAGVLGIRQVSPGALVTAGTAITTLDDLDLIKVDFTVPEKRLTQVKIGQDIVALSAAWPEATFEGKVAVIDSRVNSTTRAVKAQAHLPNPDLKLRPGMLLTVTLISRPRQAIAIPEKAILTYAEKQYAFVLGKDDKVERRQLTLGVRETGWVEIEKGLKKGEKIVVEGLMDLKDGAQVRVAEVQRAKASPASQSSAAN